MAEVFTERLELVEGKKRKWIQIRPIGDYRHCPFGQTSLTQFPRTEEPGREQSIQHPFLVVQAPAIGSASTHTAS